MLEHRWNLSQTRPTVLRSVHFYFSKFSPYSQYHHHLLKDASLFSKQNCVHLKWNAFLVASPNASTVSKTAPMCLQVVSFQGFSSLQRGERAQIPVFVVAT